MGNFVEFESAHIPHAEKKDRDDKIMHWKNVLQRLKNKRDDLEAAHAAGDTKRMMDIYDATPDTYSGIHDDLSSQIAEVEHSLKEWETKAEKKTAA